MGLPFPENGAKYTNGGDSVWAFRFDYGVLNKEKLIYKIPNTDLMVVSPPDGYCGFYALASMAYLNQNDRTAYEDALSASARAS